MSLIALAEQPEVRCIDRQIGRILGQEPGPTLVCIGSMHGNEPCGVAGLRRVFERLTERPVPLRGEFVGLVGNRQAYAAARRFLDADLNRHWQAHRIAASRAGELAESSVTEDRELDALRRELEEIFARARGEVFLIDFHSTSGGGPPFVTMSDTLRNRAFSQYFPAPVIVGLEEEIEGTLTDFVGVLGHVSVGFEGGQHDDPRSVDHVEASIWIALRAAGLVDEASVPHLTHSHQCLHEVCQDLPKIFEVRYRHGITAGNGFRMLPGFISFQSIHAGELLAHDAHGALRAREAGRILMPLYQEQGEDGYFEIREFSPFWLRVSALLRHLRADKIVHWLPGVSRHPALPDALSVDRRVARFFVLEIFHLLGYRRHRDDGKRLMVSRRKESRRSGED